MSRINLNVVNEFLCNFNLGGVNVIVDQETINFSSLPIMKWRHFTVLRIMPAIFVIRVI